MIQSSMSSSAGKQSSSLAIQHFDDQPRSHLWRRCFQLLRGSLVNSRLITRYKVVMSKADMSLELTRTRSLFYSPLITQRLCGWKAVEIEAHQKLIDKEFNDTNKLLTIYYNKVFPLHILWRLLEALIGRSRCQSHQGRWWKERWCGRAYRKRYQGQCCLYNIFSPHVLYSQFIRYILPL